MTIKGYGCGRQDGMVILRNEPNRVIGQAARSSSAPTTPTRRRIPRARSRSKQRRCLRSLSVKWCGSAGRFALVPSHVLIVFPQSSPPMGPWSGCDGVGCRADPGVTRVAFVEGASSGAIEPAPEHDPGYALSGWRQRNPLKRAKSLSVVTSSHACSMARTAR